MLLIQMTGMSGAGKSTIAQAAQERLVALGYPVEWIDGDVYRQRLCKDLGFSKADRLENIRRLGAVGLERMQNGVIALLAVINPYEEARAGLSAQSPNVKTVFIQCPLPILQQRDTKGLYKRAALPKEHPDYVAHFTGISDPFEPPEQPDLIIATGTQSVADSAAELVAFIINNCNYLGA